MRNSIGNFIFGVPLEIQKNIKLLSNNPFLNKEFAPAAAPKTLLFGTAHAFYYHSFGFGGILELTLN